LAGLVHPFGRMDINYSAVFAKIQELLASDHSVNSRMGEIINICSRDVPHGDWHRLAAIDYDADIASLSTWIGEVFARDPAPFPIKGLWFGLGNPIYADRTVSADISVSSLYEYAPDDGEMGWLWTGKRHYPNDAYANSSSLRGIYGIAYPGKQKLGNDAEWPLGLAFGAFAVVSLLRGQTAKLVGSTASRIGVVVGFNDGDMLKVGELTQENFAISAKC
jgi:hypothetical protein